MRRFIPFSEAVAIYQGNAFCIALAHDLGPFQRDRQWWRLNTPRGLYWKLFGVFDG